MKRAIQIADSTIYQGLQGEAVLLNMQTQTYFGLNDTGAAMWEALLSCDSVDAACERLLKVYAVDSVMLRNDLEKLLGELLSAGLIQGD